MTIREHARSNEPWVLGIGASHNGAACLLHGDRIVAAIQEERLSRFKRDRVFPGFRDSFAVAYCLQTAGIRPSDLDLVVLCGQYRVHSPEYDLAFNRQLALVSGKIPWLIISHHLGHAVHAFATSGFEDAAVLVVDGLGSPFDDLPPEEQALAPGSEAGWEAISLYDASGTTVAPIEKQLTHDNDWLVMRPDGMPRFRTLGGMYSAAAAQIFGNAMEAGKVMGLAPYGTATFAPEEFFTITDGRFVFHDGVPERFNHRRRWPDCEVEYRNLARSVQEALEVAADHLFDRLSKLSRSRNLCYSGGVALNCIANEKLFRGSLFRDVYIPPAAEDSGIAMGAAYYGLWHLTGRNTRRALRKDAVGRVYSREEIDRAIQATPGVKVTKRGADEVLDATVARLCDGEFAGWFQGGSELGPRALGGRSIVADPRRPDAKDQLNGRVKARESFQPFAPAILEDQAGEWFEVEGTSTSSPFMLRVWPFKPGAAAGAGGGPRGRHRTGGDGPSGRGPPLLPPPGPVLARHGSPDHPQHLLQRPRRADRGDARGRALVHAGERPGFRRPGGPSRRTGCVDPLAPGPGAGPARAALRPERPSRSWGTRGKQSGGDRPQRASPDAMGGSRGEAADDPAPADFRDRRRDGRVGTPREDRCEHREHAGAARARPDARPASQVVPHRLPGPSGRWSRRG